VEVKLLGEAIVLRVGPPSDDDGIHEIVTYAEKLYAVELMNLTCNVPLLVLGDTFVFIILPLASRSYSRKKKTSKTRQINETLNLSFESNVLLDIR